MSNRLATVSGVVVLIVASTLMQGCSSIKSAFGLGTKAEADRNIPSALEVPPTLSVEAINNSMSIPGGQNGTATYSEIAKGNGASGSASQSGKNTFSSNAQAEIVKRGQKAWLKVNLSPAEALNKVKVFLTVKQFPIQRDETALGFVETDWINNNDLRPRSGWGSGFFNIFDNGVKDKFRFRVDVGESPDVAEIFVTHRGAEKVAQKISSAATAQYDAVGVSDSQTATVGWVSRPSDPEIEIEMIRRFLLFLGRDEKTVEAMTAAVKADETVVSSSLVKGGAEYPVSLLLPQRYFYAWREVGMALDRAGFTVNDRDRLDGKYYVRFDPKVVGVKKKQGFFDSIAFWRDDAALPPEPYIIHVIEEGEKTRVEVMPDAQSEVTDELAEKILLVIEQHL